MKDERDEHLDRPSKAWVYLRRKYWVRPFHELELSLVPLGLVRYHNGRISLLKSRYTPAQRSWLHKVPLALPTTTDIRTDLHW